MKKMAKEIKNIELTYDTKTASVKLYVAKRTKKFSFSNKDAAVEFVTALKENKFFRADIAEKVLKG